MQWEFTYEVLYVGLHLKMVNIHIFSSFQDSNKTLVKEFFKCINPYQELRGIGRQEVSLVNEVVASRNLTNDVQGRGSSSQEYV